MKRLLTLALVATGVTAAAFAGSSTLKITPPIITSVTINGIPTSVSASDQINVDLSTNFRQIQDSLNTDFFSKYHDQTDLAKGFSDANASAFDNATLNSFQNYDLFSVMLGWNLGATGVPLDTNQLSSKLDDVKNKGDSFVGFGTGGIAGQFGLNVGFLIPKLYLSAKLGFWPQTTFGSGNTVAFQQSMFGLGANYRLVDKYDVILGLFTWRGISVGSGLIYNGSSTDVTVDVGSKSQQFNTTVGGNTVPINASLDNIKAKMTIDTQTIVIPIDVSTSAQFLWLLNAGFGAGVDVAFSGAKVSVGADSDINVKSSDSTVSIQTQPGSAVVTADNTNGNGDIFLPRIYGSIGANVSALKVDVPITYYPVTQTFVAGVSVGAVW